MRQKFWWSISRKWLIIALLCAGLYAFGYGDGMITTVGAAPCFEWCDSELNYCRDECEDECDESSTNHACGTCIIACQNDWLDCMSFAVSCEGETVNPARCQTNFGLYCPKNSSGSADCSNPSANYNHYSTQCNVLGHPDWQCVNCPATNNYTCENPNQLPLCP